MTLLPPDIDRLLPTDAEKDLLEALQSFAPQTITGARDDPEAALASLLDALEDLGLIRDSTSVS